MKKALYLCLILLLVSLNSVSCKKESEEVTVAQKDEEEAFFKEELPALEEWAETEWEEREWEEEEPAVELETTGGLKEAMAATSLAMRKLGRSVNKRDFSEIVDSGKKVEDLIAGRCVTLYYKQHPSGVPTQFIVVGDRFRSSIHSLIMSAKAGSESGVRSNYLTVKGTCKDCHKVFRKEE